MHIHLTLEIQMWELACDGGLPADTNLPDTPRSNCGAGLLAKTACQPTLIYLKPHDPTVGAGLPAMAACQPTPIYLTPHDQTVGAGLLAKAAWQSTQLDCVHIHCCGNGYLGFRLTAGHFRKARK